MTTYLGYDVLDYVQHNRATDPQEDLRWSFAESDNGTGRTFVEDASGSPVPTRIFSWFMQTRADILTFKAFMDARKGMLVPFWVPTYNNDLVLGADIGAGAGGLTIQSINYTDFYFPQTARHHLAIVSPDGSFIIRKVTLAADNGDGTETLTLDSTIPTAMSKDSTMVSFLTFCRLAVDAVEIMWHTNDMAEVALQLLELPREVPA